MMWGCSDRGLCMCIQLHPDQQWSALSLQTTHVCESKAHDSPMMPSWVKATIASNRIQSGLIGLGVLEPAQVIT